MCCVVAYQVMCTYNIYTINLYIILKIVKVFWNLINSLMYIFCNNYSEKLSEFHIHDDLYINRAYYWYTSRRPVNRPSGFLKSQT